MNLKQISIIFLTIILLFFYGCDDILVFNLSKKQVQIESSLEGIWLDTINNEIYYLKPQKEVLYFYGFTKEGMELDKNSNAVKYTASFHEIGGYTFISANTLGEGNDNIAALVSKKTDKEIIIKGFYLKDITNDEFNNLPQKYREVIFIDEVKKYGIKESDEVYKHLIKKID